MRFPFYFGCHEGPGHFWWVPAEQKPDVMVRAHGGAPTFLDPVIDGGFCPPGDQIEGLTNVVHININHEAATVLAFWDRSVDKRGNCNSAFLLKGTLSFNEAIMVIRTYFPAVWNRRSFPIVEWKP